MVRIRKQLNVADLITENHYTQPEIAKAMGKSVTYVSNRCTRKEPWTMDDVIFMANLFGLSDDETMQYFAHPSEKAKKRGKNGKS